MVSNIDGGQFVSPQASTGRTLRREEIETAPAPLSMELFE
jgi:hypothetical protein